MKRVFFPLFALCLYNIGCKQESDEVSTTGPAQDGDQLCQCMKKAVEQSSNMRRALIECNQQEKEKYDQYISTPEDYSLFVESYESCLQKKENSKTAKTINTFRIQKRDAELKSNIASIKTALFAYKKQHGKYIACEAYPPKPNKYAKKWIAEKSGNFQQLNWKPEYDVRGSYSVKVDGDKFKIIGLIDVDGDGNFAKFIATATQDAKQPMTPPDVY